MKATGRPGKKKAPPKSPAPRKTSTETQAAERLLVEAAQSDPARFDALYELNFERVYGFIAGRVRDRGTAEDLTSEVFYKALANLRSLDRKSTRLNSSHSQISYAVFCLKKKKLEHLQLYVRSIP